MKKVTIVIVSVLCLYLPQEVKAQSQQLASTDKNSVGGGCEGCDLMFVEIPPTIKSDVTITDPNESGEQLEVYGVIYKSDGKTPAPNVVLYVYQTAKSGLYEAGPNQNGGVRRHGRIRGWVKSNQKGEYKFVTIRPGNYPNADIPAHIHPTIKEPDKNEYHIDDFVFDDDKFVDDDYRSRQQLRGGSGILHLKKENGKWIGKRDIILGRNIPNYLR